MVLKAEDGRLRHVFAETLSLKSCCKSVSYLCNFLLYLSSIIPAWDRLSNWQDWFSLRPLSLSVKAREKMLATYCNWVPTAPQPWIGDKLKELLCLFFHSSSFTCSFFTLSSAELLCFGLALTRPCPLMRLQFVTASQFFSSTKLLIFFTLIAFFARNLSFF